ncbi:sigma-70 family RNA polymerase sigma factor [Anaerococcus provencensis]|uniref:sigma-70 family RNA polymerase sigma factor n=1 Tax=Anaerococcus provencensis TaxID=938293 RepID=UPI0005CB5426|nr:sigma-70 family RNA polymerase sigma factor [Anaerococcus provencensis]
MQITLANSKQIIDSYMPLLISMARKFPSFDYDEDIDQTRMILVECIPAYDESKGTFGNFLKNQLRYHYLDRTKKLNPQSLDDFDQNGNPIVDTIPDDYDFEVQILNNYKDLYLAIGQLSQKDQEIIRLKYWENLSNAEIGHILNISSKTVANRHSFSLKKLKDLMER